MDLHVIHYPGSPFSCDTLLLAIQPPAASCGAARWTIIPVEVKSGRAPEAPYDSHIYQLASYCLLVEKTYGKRPPYGIIHYRDRDFAIDYTQELESSLLDLLAEMKRDEHRKDVPRSHEQASRCARCGFRNVCDQRIT
jgi:CRISPR-associated exonuclease Cas4